jgi:toxin HigB-1
LSGKWDGHRASRLGLQWRVIYLTVPDQQLFQVMTVTPHDYRRP